ncbi:MAG: glycosyltransferase family 39 protein [Bacteroidales bacterium]|nr:glycosyltransferase family 39 protein [Bacteroidales bacterium]
MPNKLQRHFNLIGIALYGLALAIVSICFSHYALRPLWIAWGCGTVLFFFLCTYFCFQSWQKKPEKTFLRRVFWVALGLRAIHVTAILYYYYYQTGIGLEYQAADSLGYHRAAAYFSNLAREGRISEIFSILNANTMGFSDQGYVLYLTGIYTIFGKNILGPRLLKALMSAYMCVAIYKLTSRSIDNKTGRLAAVMAVFLPQFYHYNGTYLKETELIFVATLALERFDYLMRTRKHLAWNLILTLALTALTFGLRTIVGMILIGSYLIYVVFAEKELLSKKAKAITLAAVIATSLFFLATPIGKEMLIIFKVNFTESNYQVAKYKYLGLKYADYANYKTMAPGAFVLPLTNLTEVANENQKMMNGTYFIKNYLAFFAMWCIIVAIRDKKWRRFSLIGSYTLAYILMIAFSFAFNSERYHLPVMPGFLIMGAFAMTRFRKKDFKWYYAYIGLLVVAIVTWNYLKLSARGLIF